MWTSIFKKIIFVFLFSFLFSANGSAKERFTEDTSHVTVRSLDPVTQQKLLSDPIYQYDKIGPKPESAWDRFWEWLGRKLGDGMNSDGNIGFLIFEFILIAAALALIIYLLLKNDAGRLFYGKSANVQIDFSEFDDDIHRVNLDELIAKAMLSKDLRRAVRLHFLKLLKELSEAGHIKWQIDKTNKDYSIELSNSHFHNNFRELASLYEYVWYGDFQADENYFQSAISKFNAFKI
jgi:hypothetical protein